MASAVSLRKDYSAAALRRLAAFSKNANQSRRLLSLAAVLDGMNRTQAARIGGMDRQTLRDWVHRFNERGPEGLLDGWSKGPEPRRLLPSRAPELNPVENVWQHLRQTWLSNRVFETYDQIIEAACDAWNRLIAQPHTITSIGSRQSASTGQT